jgi:adenosine deaminase
LSNVALRVVDELSEHPLPAMIEGGLLVSVHSDDPAYFGGYVGANYRGVQQSLGLDDSTITMLARNSIVASFLDAPRKEALLQELEAVSAGDEG